MFNISKKITAAVFTIGMMIPQATSANFYVIPVGQSPIPTSAVKSFNSDCVTVANGKTTLPYTVPEGKAFIVKSIRISQCNSPLSAWVPGLVEVGSDYREYIRLNNGSYVGDRDNLFNYDLGILMQSGEQISFTNLNSSASATPPQLMISVTGYETRP